MGRKQNFEISLSLLPLLSLFLPSFCFFCRAFTRIRFGRKCRFRILGLDLDESIGGRRNKIFTHEEFSANVICCLFVVFFFAFFAHLQDWIMLILVWFERTLPLAEVGWQLMLSLIAKTDDVTNCRMHGRFREERVNQKDWNTRLVPTPRAPQPNPKTHK